MLALEVNKILPATPSKLRREKGMCATTIYVQQQQHYTIRLLVVRTPVSSLSFQVQHTWYLVQYMQAPNRLYKAEVRGSVSRVKTHCEQGLHHCTYVLQAEQRLPHGTEEKAKRSFPMECGPTAKHHHPAWNPQCTQWFRAEEFPLLCPKPKVMPRFSLGDVGEAWWPLSHRWTDAKSILPDAAHDSRNQGRVVSFSVLSPLSACVRLCQLREVHHSLQQALHPWSRTRSAATDGSPACCTSSLMLRVCVILRELRSQSSVRSLLGCCCTNSGSCPVWPVLFGAI